MSPDQPASPDAERDDDRADAEREGEREDAEREREGKEAEREEGGAEGEDGRSLRDDVKELPGAMREDTRRVYRQADESLSERMERQPALERALDLRIVLASLAIAFVLALVLRLLGLSPVISIVIFLIALAGLWVGLARFYSARRPKSRPEGEREAEQEDEDGSDDEDGG